MVPVHTNAQLCFPARSSRGLIESRLGVVCETDTGDGSVVSIGLEITMEEKKIARSTW